MDEKIKRYWKYLDETNQEKEFIMRELYGYISTNEKCFFGKDELYYIVKPIIEDLSVQDFELACKLMKYCREDLYYEKWEEEQCQ